MQSLLCYVWLHVGGVLLLPLLATLLPPLQLLLRLPPLLLLLDVLLHKQRTVLCRNCCHLHC